MTTVIYIAPNSGETHHPQARLYRRDFTPLNGYDVRDNYRRNPDKWAEVGLMTAQGKLVCFDGPADQLEDLRACEPLMAGNFFVYEEN